MSNDSDSIVIVGMARTAIGAFKGAFSDMSATDLGAAVIKSAVSKSNISADTVNAALMGCVLPAGLGQAPARQAAIGAGLSDTTACMTINKMCGSGLQSVMTAADMLQSGTHDIIVAGGMESMTNAPYLIPKARAGQRMGDAQLIDHMFFDGLQDAYDRGKLMGVFADQCAAEFNLTREEQDRFALKSLSRAQNAAKNGLFDNEITPVTVKTRKSEVVVKDDEQPQIARPDKIPHLKPAFAKDGTVTAANASSISDGAAAVVLTRESIARQKGLPVIAKIAAHSVYAQKPSEFSVAPISALRKLSEKTGWDFNDVDLFEINEAFAVVTMAAMKKLGLPHQKVNIHGGACALGHPIGASGARILVTLLSALQKYDGHKGMATLCIGGGEAVALAVERVE